MDDAYAAQIAQTLRNIEQQLRAIASYLSHIAQAQRRQS
jgi:hypothetical protein